MKGFSSSLSAKAKPFVPSLSATSSLADVDSCFLSPVLPEGITVTNGISENYTMDPETGFITDYFSPFLNFKKLEIDTNIINSSLKIPFEDENQSLIDSPCYKGTQDQNNNHRNNNIKIFQVGETSAPPIVTVQKLKSHQNGLGSCMKKEKLLSTVHGLSEMLVYTCPNAELAAGDYMKLQIVIQNLEKLLEKSSKAKFEENIRVNIYKSLWKEAEDEKSKLKS